jgi:nucleotide-binding universal stress UspA family protein
MSMRDVKLIVAPVDFSEGSEAAARYAFGLGGRLGARVRLLHAFAGLSHASAGVAPGLRDDLRAAEGQLRQEARQSLEDLAGRLAREAGAAAEEPLFVEAGPAVAEAIVKAARDAKADLVVIGTHGRTGLRRMVLGSVAEKVARAAECPVLIVK